jgi:flagellar hook protein FlgE
MLRSMFSGVSGLRSHQTMMDVIGNNIDNVNTPGFKSSSVVFADLLSQLQQGAGAPQGVNGGTNPAQVGLGVNVAAINTSFTQGASQYTGRPTDLSIQGDGFLMANLGGQQLYTRAGALSFDTNGSLVTPDGAKIQGWMASPDGTVNINTSPTDLVFPPGQVIAPAATKNVVVGGNLPADATGPVPGPATVIDTSVTLYDTQGKTTPVTFEYTFQGADQWSVQAKDATGASIGAAAALKFDPATGQLAPPVVYSITPPGVFPTPVNINFGKAGDPNALVQFAGTQRVSVISQDGAPIGSLQSFSVSADGLVTGVFTNGTNQPLGRISLATFNNPMGLEKSGNSLYRATVNSGLAQIGISGTNGRGMISAGTLEMSNVDLAQEFTNLIVAQRGFQANSKVITASDQVLQDLVNLKQ